MGLPDIDFIRTQGVGGVDPINSHISALLFYNDTLPSGFTALERIKSVFSVQQAEDLGIVDDYSDETAAVDATIQITVKGATGDVESAFIGTGLLASYTILSTDADADAVATGLGAAINANTKIHGFSATVATDTVTVSPPTGAGKSLTSNALTFSSSGTGTATVTDFVSTSAAGSMFAVMHYHISEFFRQKPDGKLYIGIYAEGTFDGTGIIEIINYANGEVRRVGVFEKVEPFATSMLSAIEAILVTARDEHKPSSSILHANMSGLVVDNLADLTNATATKVNVNAGEDGNFLLADYNNTKSYSVGDKITFIEGVYQCILASTGNSPYNTNYWTKLTDNLRAITGFSISTLGNEVGTKAAAALSQNVGEVQAFNLTAGVKLSEAGVSTGDLFADLTTGQKDLLADKNYTYLRTFEGREGVYFTDDYTAISRTNDYRSLARNEVMDEAERLVYSALLPRLNSRVYLNDAGQLSRDSINDFEELVITALTQLQVQGDISGAPIVTIDPNQNIAVTSKLDISFSIQPVGIARNIQVNNSYQVNTGG
jgi:hypothetical protein